MASARALRALLDEDEEGGDGEEEEDAHQREGGPARHGAREQVDGERRQDAAGDLEEARAEVGDAASGALAGDVVQQRGQLRHRGREREEEGQQRA